MSQATGSRRFAISFDELYEMLEFVRTNSSSAGFNQTEVTRIELALDEILTNIINHSGLASEQYLEIAVGVPERPGILFEVRDKGIPFNPLQYARPTAQEEGGQGIHLARHSIDKIHYSREGDVNTLVLIKYLQPKG